jgi:HK97 family phage major capsid protein
VKKTVKQLNDAKQEALSAMQNLIENAEAEDRNLTVDEQAAWNEAEKTANDMSQRAERLERSMQLSKTPVAPVTFETQSVAKTDKDLKRFSFTAAASAAYNGQMDGIVREMHEEARNENKSRLFRGVGVPSICLEHRAAETLPAASGNVKPTDVGSFIDQLQANMVLVQAGCNFYSGISADRKFPIITDIDSGYLAETNDGQDAAGKIDAVTLSPKKLISVVSMSAEMMTQNASAEAALQRNMARSISATWEAAMLDGVADITNAPASIFKGADAVSPAAAGDLGTTELIDMEAQILKLNYNPAAGRFAYLFNPATLAQLKAELGTDYTNGAFADFAARTINGYPYYVSSNVGNSASSAPAQAALFGDFSDVHLATFGGLDIISDRYTDAHKGLSRLVVVSLNDGVAAHTTATKTSLVKAEKAA